ncbi:hypothetical protein Aph01nite_10410 [Acrocarpospora phusangensis]|uniref:OmpR/PhoB-type domain-containing protein n=1 Tax=Acrocarpospora phusangensis TaxID=1070424 RepID=A0A919Q709_9ACTN|nr:hypothetical protein Aph01nite_10410 [Acrocarpospora phusangensis]
MLGTIEAAGPDGQPLALGDRQRALLAALLARAGEVVSVDRLADLIWGDGQPAHPQNALHTQVSRLRRLLDGTDLRTQPPGYILRVEAADVDALRFGELAGAARHASPEHAVDLLDEALSLWRGPAYAEFADSDAARLDAIRLEQARLEAVEARAAALLECGRAAEAVPSLDACIDEHPLREQARALLMRALYALGRHAEALRGYQDYRRRLADELGLEPSAAIAELHLRILRHDLPATRDTAATPPPLSAIRVRYTTTPGGRTLAYGTLGEGPPLVALPAWVSAIDVISSGRDPRSSILQRLAGHVELTIYDRYGTGLSRGHVDDYGLDASVDELAAIARRVGRPVNLLAISQAGPVAIAFAARHPDLVDRLVFFGTYASASGVFTHTELNNTLVNMVRAHWGMASRLFADLFRPGGSDTMARHLAEVLKDSAGRDVAAGYLQAVYEADTTALLPHVTAPSLVLHYTGDRVIPFAGSHQLTTGLPDAHLIALDGPYHLPDATNLTHIVESITSFLTPQTT